MTSEIKSPRTSGTSGAMYQAEQRKETVMSSEDKLMARLGESLNKLKNSKK